MAEDILTNSGISRGNGVDYKISNMPLQPKSLDKTLPPEQNKTEKEKLKEEVREFNKKPEVKENNLILIKKSTKYFWMATTIILLISIIAFGIWFNISFMNKDLSPSFFNEVQVNNTHNIQNTDENQFTIINQINLSLGDDLVNTIVNLAHDTFENSQEEEDE